MNPQFNSMSSMNEVRRSAQRPQLRSNPQEWTRQEPEMPRVRKIKQTTRRAHKQGHFVWGRGTWDGPNERRNPKSHQMGLKQSWVFKDSREKPTRVYFLPRQNMPRPNNPPTNRPPARPPVVQRPRPTPPMRASAPGQSTPASTPPPVRTQPPVPAHPTYPRPPSMPASPGYPPVLSPTMLPIVYMVPTTTPTASIGPPDTSNPTQSPSRHPTDTLPTLQPVTSESDAPPNPATNQPSTMPVLPSSRPTMRPTQSPSMLPTASLRNPTSFPSMITTETPSIHQTQAPTQVPETLPTLPPVVAAAERTSPPSSLSNDNRHSPDTSSSEKPHSRERVQATSFFLHYNFDGRTATTQEYEAASQSTLAYLDSFMHSAFLRHDQIEYDGQHGGVLGVTTDPVTIAFSYEVYFLEAPGLHPKQSDVDRLVSTALSEPANNVLMERLSKLDERNPFSRTRKIVYSLQFNDQAMDQDTQVPGSAIALLVAGIILGMLGLSMILMRRRRFRRQGSGEETDDLLTNEQLTTLSDSDNPAAVIVSGDDSQWMDTKWSLPSGHDVTSCAPEKSIVGDEGQTSFEGMENTLQ